MVGSGTAPTKAPAPCSFFAQGKCRHGSACKFSHADRGELAPMSTQPCRFFLQNACKAGRDCRFAHISPEHAAPHLVATTSAGERKVAPGAYGKRCKFHDYGACAAGRTCPFLHIDGDGEEREGVPTQRQEVKRGSNASAKRSQASAKSASEHEQAEGEATQQDEGGDGQKQAKPQVTELSEIISKEEEMYYYGAPGEFDEMARAAEEHLEGKPSYASVTAKNVVDDYSITDGDFLEQPAGPKTCTYFLQGLCRYGDSCFYSHTLETSPLSSEELDLVREELARSQVLECGICFDNILIKGERFGLLSGCSHAFCLSCVRSWRGTADQPKQTVRQCPVCRVETHFIVPSNRMVTDPDRKQVLLNRYIDNLATIPCRHFDEGRGECPFGTSCFYAHRFPNGTEEVRQVRTAVDSEGQYDVLRQMRLEHFFQNLQD